MPTHDDRGNVTADVLGPQSLTIALAEHLGGATVTDAAATPVGTGQMSNSYRLTLQFSKEVAFPSKLVAKVPASDPVSRATAVAMGHYRTEVAFYRELAPTLTARTPRCLYAEFDESTGDFLLLLEDLAPAVAGDQLTGCSADAAGIAVAELAKVHIRYWDSPYLADLPWLKPRFIDDSAVAMMAGVLPVFCDRLGDRVDEDILGVAEILFAQLPTYVDESAEAQTLRHGDFRLDNLLFGGAGGDAPAVAVVDWQTLSRGSGLLDLAYFIGGCFTSDERRRHEPALIDRYRSEMAAAGIDLPDDYFWTHYRRHTFGGLLMAIGSAALAAQTTRGDDLFVAMAQRHGRHAIDLDAKDLLC